MRLEGREGWPQGSQRWLQQIDKVGEKDMADGSAGIRGSKGLSWACGWKFKKKGGCHIRRDERKERSYFRGPPVPLGSNEKSPTPIHLCCPVSCPCRLSLWTWAQPEGQIMEDPLSSGPSPVGEEKFSLLSLWVLWLA